MTKVRKFCLVVSAAVAVLLSSCLGGGAPKDNPLLGVWRLYDAEYLYDDETMVESSETTEFSEIRVYTSDSLVLDVYVMQDRDSREYISKTKQHYSYTKIPDGSILYDEDDYKCQVQITDDTVMVLKKLGQVFYYRRTNIFDDDIADLLPKLLVDGECQELRSITCAPYYSNKKTQKEKAQTGTINIMLLVLGIVGIVVIGLVAYFVITRRQKKLMRQQLKRLQEEKEYIAANQIQSFADAEQRFWESEYYADFCSRIDRMAPFSEDDWIELEHQVNATFPSFIPNLRSIVKLSQVEYRTCLLIKLKVSPSAIAPIVHRAPTTISSIRSRLYKKVFGKSGSSQDWDDFVLSI